MESRSVIENRNTGVPEIRLPMLAGPHSIGVAFLRKSRYCRRLVAPPARSTADTYVGQQVGYTPPPSRVCCYYGPFNVSARDTAAEDRLPAGDRREELPCAEKLFRRWPGTPSATG